MVQIESQDIETCPDCFMDVVRVAFWDTVQGRVRSKHVKKDWAQTVRFERRDKDHHLVVEDKELVMRNAHGWECKDLPPAPPAGSEDDEPRDKRKLPW